MDPSIELNPECAHAYHNRGIAYGEKGDYEQAIADYTEAIRINPDLAYARQQPGHCLRQEE